jgi:long-chain acyl-CoA synthetase
VGAGAGDRVVVIAVNAPAVVDLAAAAVRAGVLPVPLNVHLPPSAQATLTRDADPVVVVTDEAHADGAAAARVGAPVVQLGTEVLAAVPADPVDLPRWPQARPMHYTSGTTGRAKGVCSGVLGPDLGRAMADDERVAWGFDPDDLHLVCGPLYHSAPLRFALLTVLFGGEVLVDARFDAEQALGRITAERVTSTFLAPTLLARLLDRQAAQGGDLGSLRLVAHAGAPTPEAVKRRALDVFPPGSVWEFYGSTEGQCTQISPEQWVARPGSVGPARPGRRLHVTDGQGRPLPPGQVGTVWCTAPAHAAFTYWRDPTRTASAWDGDRFTVGDHGALDPEGFLWLSGRREDLVISGGVNVYPVEVEQVLLSHPDVAEGVVFGVPDPAWGERVCAAVVARGGAAIDPGELRDWLRRRLAGFQTPKQVLVLDDLPRTGSGKVVRTRLAEALRDVL